MNTSQSAFFNQAMWQKLYAPGTDKEFCLNWLNIQCSMMHDVRRAAVYLDPKAGSPVSPTASWPEDSQPLNRFDEIVQRVLSEGKCIASLEADTQETTADENKSFILGCPFNIETKLQGVAVFHLRTASDRELQIAMRQVQWSMTWLKNLFLRKKSGDAGKPDGQLSQRLMTVFDVVAAALEENRFKAAATVAVTELATRLGCERVSVGFTAKKLSKVVAVSHSAQFAQKMNLVSSIGEAMDESIDQCSTVLFPPVTGQHDAILLCHAALQSLHGSRSILTVPFLDAEGEGYGAFTFERAMDKPFDSDTVLLCEAAAALLGPILKEKQLNDLPLYRKVAIHFSDRFGKLVGPGNPALKFGICCLAGLLLFFAVASGDYRVTATSVLEGTVQRSVIAPFDGYLFEAPARAGDIVSKDQVMASLDTRDLLLQRLKSASQQKQFALEYNKALAKNEIAQSNIIKEQMSQAESEVSLLDEQIARAKIRVPFDGIIITGDWSQSIGAPIERGQTLFQIAPLDSYRVMLEVAEGDIDQVTVEQKGELVLNAMPGTPHAFTVEKITPVTTTREGSNFFLVEGRILQDSKKLRPGMQGYGKIHIARRKLIWIWMHDLIDWLRIRFWAKIS
jgi:hypothetical protein